MGDQTESKTNAFVAPKVSSYAKVLWSETPSCGANKDCSFAAAVHAMLACPSFRDVLYLRRSQRKVTTTASVMREADKISQLIFLTGEETKDNNASDIVFDSKGGNLDLSKFFERFEDSKVSKKFQKLTALKLCTADACTIENVLEIKGSSDLTLVSQINNALGNRRVVAPLPVVLVVYSGATGINLEGITVSERGEVLFKQVELPSCRYKLVSAVTQTVRRSLRSNPGSLTYKVSCQVQNDGGLVWGGKQDIGHLLFFQRVQ